MFWGWHGGICILAYIGSLAQIGHCVMYYICKVTPSASDSSCYIKPLIVSDVGNLIREEWEGRGRGV